MIEKFKSLLKKKTTWIILALIVSLGGYLGVKSLRAKGTTVRYVTSPVTRGTITASVSGTGQVSSSNQIDIKPPASAKVIKLNVTAGQNVKANDVLAQLDAGDAQKAVRDARTSLTTAELSLEKIRQPADALTLTQAQDAVANAQTALEKLKLSQPADYQKAQDTEQNAQDAITKGYEDGFSAISDTFLDLPTIMSALDDSLHSTGIADTEPTVTQKTSNVSALLNTLDSSEHEQIQVFVDSAETDYQTARKSYDASFADYKNSNRSSDQAVIDSMLTETLDTSKAVAQAIKSISNMYDKWVDLRKLRNRPIFTKVVSYQTSLGTYAGQANSHLSSLLSQQASIKSNKQALLNAQRDLKQMDQNNPLDLAAAQQAVVEKQASLDKLQAGPDTIDVRTQELSVQQRRDALTDAQQKLADYTIRAPIDGVVAKVSVKVSDTTASGTAAFTLVTTQQVADISLNEVDVAKIKVGQKATISFSAIDGLSLTGTVGEIDTIGTVTQNVVNYSAKILFDTQDDRVKPGMSVSVSVITDVKQDVLNVPSAAVKGQGGQSYVEILVNGKPEQHSVEIGLSSDTATEISGDIKEGDEAVTQTISSVAVPAAQRSGASVLQGLGGGAARQIGGGGFGGGRGN